MLNSTTIITRKKKTTNRTYNLSCVYRERSLKDILVNDLGIAISIVEVTGC